MDQQHSRKVAHTLDIANIWSTVLKSSEHIDETLTQRVNLLEKLIEVWKCPRNILYQQRIFFHRSKVHPLGWLRAFLRVPF